MTTNGKSLSGGGISGVYGYREKVGTEDRAMCQVNSYLLYKMELLGDFVCLLEFDMFIKHARYFSDNEAGNKRKVIDTIRVMVLLSL